VGNLYSRAYDPYPNECEVCGYVARSTVAYFHHLGKHPVGELTRRLEPRLFGSQPAPPRDPNGFHVDGGTK